MNRTMVYTVSLTLFCASAHANVTPASAATPPAAVSATTTPATVPANAAPAVITPAAQPSAPVAQPAPVINCQYRISAETRQIEQPLLITWTEKATVQSFDFNPATMEEQLAQLKDCFTEQGWQGFNDALQNPVILTLLNRKI